MLLLLDAAIILLLQADVAGSLGLRGLAHDQLLASHDLPGIILARPLIGLLAENGQSKLEWFQKKLLDARIVPKLENTGCRCPWWLLFSFSQ